MEPYGTIEIGPLNLIKMNWSGLLKGKILWYSPESKFMANAQARMTGYLYVNHNNGHQATYPVWWT